MELLVNREKAVVDFDHERRRYNDTTTLLAEMLEGNMRTPFEYCFDGNELYGNDGSPLEPIFNDALRDAEKLGPNLKFEARRRTSEKGEYNEMKAMARGEKPNTMVVVSDFPAELMDAKRDIGGYNVQRKQTMLRVITRTRDGRILMRSQSLDLSDRTALEAIYDELGFAAEPGELLGQRMHVDLDARGQEYLIDKLMGVYDRALSGKFGGEWYAGRKDARKINTYDFVCSQNDLLSTYLNLGSYSLESETFYDLAAAMQSRLDRPAGIRLPEVSHTVAAENLIVLRNPYIEMRQAGNLARRQGKTFSGCGVSIGNKNNKSKTEIELDELGYGNKIDGVPDNDEDDEDEEEPYDFDKFMYCLECQAPPGEEESESWCGPCGYCEPCDKMIRARNKAGNA